VPPFSLNKSLTVDMISSQRNRETHCSRRVARPAARPQILPRQPALR